MNNLQSPQQDKIRKFLRTGGIVCLALGALLMLVAITSFASAFGTFERPRFFWLAFIGMPLLFVGAVMCQFGFLGAITRFVAGEQAPVAKDAINYMAGETQDAVKTVARSVAEGVKEGLDAKPGGK